MGETLGLTAFSKFLLACWWMTTSVYCLIVRKVPLCASFSFSLIFTCSYSLVFSSLPISWLGILPCIIHEWHTCFTHHVPTAMLCRPEGVSAMPACNLLTHRATSSQLSSPITLNSWNGPFPDTRLVVIIVSFKEAYTESSNMAYMFMSDREVIGWVLSVGAQTDKRTSLNLTVALLSTRSEGLGNINTQWQ